MNPKRSLTKLFEWVPKWIGRQVYGVLKALHKPACPSRHSLLFVSSLLLFLAVGDSKQGRLQTKEKKVIEIIKVWSHLDIKARTFEGTQRIGLLGFGVFL